jgi:hypothetical protein
MVSFALADFAHGTIGMTSMSMWYVLIVRFLPCPKLSFLSHQAKVQFDDAPLAGMFSRGVLLPYSSHRLSKVLVHKPF